MQPETKADGKHFGIPRLAEIESRRKWFFFNQKQKHVIRRNRNKKLGCRKETVRPLRGALLAKCDWRRYSVSIW